MTQIQSNEMEAEKNVCMVLCLAYVYCRLTMLKGLMEIRRLRYIWKVCMICSILPQVLSVMMNSVTNLVNKRKGRKRRVAEMYIKPRSTHWFRKQFSLLDDLQFRRMFRFPRVLFQQLVETYGTDLQRHPPVGLSSIPNRKLDPSLVISIAIHRLATGNSDVAIGKIFGV